MVKQRKVLWSRISLCDPGWPWTYYVDKAVLTPHCWEYRVCHHTAASRRKTLMPERKEGSQAYRKRQTDRQTDRFRCDYSCHIWAAGKAWLLRTPLLLVLLAPGQLIVVFVVWWSHISSLATTLDFWRTCSVPLFLDLTRRFKWNCLW